jgi:hypothetical protein
MSDDAEGSAGVPDDAEGDAGVADDTEGDAGVTGDGPAENGRSWAGARADARLALLGGLVTATGAAVVCYAVLRFVWRQVGR